MREYRQTCASSYLESRTLIETILLTSGGKLLRPTAISHNPEPLILWHSTTVLLNSDGCQLTNHATHDELEEGK